ncbi:MAG: hypothetical protein KatS3mg059_1573 [Thermomicrobiales bacterium]|nr:MAG: hypothetical protein KatS3mg059_1573 [Thermomicrobiales bacterium]
MGRCDHCQRGSHQIAPGRGVLKSGAGFRLVEMTVISCKQREPRDLPEAR